jgi:hypothetical protein
LGQELARSQEGIAKEVEHVLKLHRHTVKVIDEELEISEARYIEHLIVTYLKANPAIALKLDHEPYRSAFANKIGRLYAESVCSGKFIDEIPLTKVPTMGAALGWWTDDI